MFRSPDVEDQCVKTSARKCVPKLKKVTSLWLPTSYHWCRPFYVLQSITEVAWPIVTKLCHMFDGDPDGIYEIRLEIWVAPSTRNLTAQKDEISA